MCLQVWHYWINSQDFWHVSFRTDDFDVDNIKLTLTFLIVWVQTTLFCQCSSKLEYVWVQTATFCPCASKPDCVGADQTTTEEYTYDIV